MDRDSEFIVRLEDGQYPIRPFEGDVLLEHGAHAAMGRWEHFRLTTAGDHDGEVYRDLFYALKQQSGFDPGSRRSTPGTWPAALPDQRAGVLRAKVAADLVNGSRFAFIRVHHQLRGAGAAARRRPR